MKLGLVLSLLHMGNSLQCFSGIRDCYPNCESEECQFIFSPELNASDWICSRSLETCDSVTCSTGLAYFDENITCAEGEIYCFNQFRKPQNSRYGRQAVWGYMEVNSRGCAKVCEDESPDNNTGVGKRCCTTDFCNEGQREVVSLLLPLSIYIIRNFLDD